MGTTRVHKSQEMLAWIKKHPDQPLSTSEIAEAVNWSSSSVSTAMSRLAMVSPDTIIWLKKGVYMYRSHPNGTKPTTKEVVKDQPNKDEVLTFKVVATNGTQLLVADENRNLWEMRQFNWTPSE